MLIKLKQSLSCFFKYSFFLESNDNEEILEWQIVVKKFRGTENWTHASQSHTESANH